MPDNPFYHTGAWKRLRPVALGRDGGMCQECMREFRAGYGIKPARATMVHHIIPIEERPDLALDLNNLLSLCAKHHNLVHPEKHKAWKKKKPIGKARIIRV